jgi:hypothetical protein
MVDVVSTGSGTAHNLDLPEQGKILIPSNRDVNLIGDLSISLDRAACYKRVLQPRPSPASKR